jgi:hypothetical protein
LNFKDSPVCWEMCFADRVSSINLTVVSHFLSCLDLKLYHMLLRLPLPPDMTLIWNEREMACCGYHITVFKAPTSASSSEEVVDPFRPHLSSSLNRRPWFLGTGGTCFVSRLESLVCTNSMNVTNMFVAKKLNSLAWVRKRTMPTERLPLVGEVSANFCGWRVPRGQRDM